MSKNALESSDTRAPLSVERISRMHAGTSVQGYLTSPDSLYFNGTLQGEIKLNNRLVLGEKANIKGNIYATSLTVLGKVEGDIYTKGSVTFGSISSFKGKITAKTVEVQHGALFNAKCLVKPSDDDPKELDQPSEPEMIIEPEENLIVGNTSEGEGKSFFFGIFQNQ
jgi:cytoskeletal protein CcmA (bactofilin family)